MSDNMLNVLLVDDNQDDIILTTKALKKFDRRFMVDAASTGEDCLKKLKAQNYNVLLLDYSLPGMDGISVLNKVVKAGYDTPIIIVTGQGNESIAVKSMKKGAYDYIIKSGDYLKILPVVIQKVVEKFELDKTKQRLVKETIDKKSKLDATLNSTSDGILMISFNDCGKPYVSIINKRFKDIFKFKSSDDAQTTIDEDTITINELNVFLNKRWHYPGKKTKDFFNSTLKKTYEQTDIIESKSEKKMVIERYTGPVFDGDKNIIGRIWSFKDVTEQVDLEKKLKILSITDSLTKLYNQGHFYEVLEKEVERSRRMKNSLSLILFDIDKFKDYNDTKGHQAGDRVLEKIGKIVSTVIRAKVDSGYRYGGDEFTVILPETNIKQAISVAQRIRESFAECGYASLSLGLLELRPDYSVDELVRFADKAMYEAKGAGGNQLSVWNKGKNPEKRVAKDSKGQKK